MLLVQAPENNSNERIKWAQLTLDSLLTGNSSYLLGVTARIILKNDSNDKK